LHGIKGLVARTCHITSHSGDMPNGQTKGVPAMKGDAKVIEYLNAALRSELTAVSQYWLHYRLQEDWGYGRIAAKSREECIEEMHHADKMIARIIFLGGHPNLQKLDPLRIGQSLRETLEADLAAEHDARALYIEARDHCESVKDYVTKALFEELITDEEGHIDFLETQIDLFDRLGEANYGLLQAKPANEAE
jgi:bacterioferritin